MRSRGLGAAVWLWLGLLGAEGYADEASLVVKDGSALAANPCGPGGKKEGEICDAIQARVCLNGSCSSVCAVEGMSECRCVAQADRECYRCCGNARHACRPAHAYSIFKPNGERWEKASCSVCADMEDGLPCDDKDPEKLCKAGRCTSDLCRGLPDGAVCDLKKTKLCVDNRCVQPCTHNRILCDCDMTYLSMERAVDRCQLCCYDWEAKTCRPAFKHYGITTQDKRPVPRTGLTCGRRKTCDRYGICTKGRSSTLHALPLLSLLTPALSLFLWVHR